MDAVIIAFVSGKGGTGKSTAAVHVGAALAELSRRVLLVEVDSALRSVDLIAGLAGQAVYDAGDVFAGRAGPGKAMVQSPAAEGLFLIPAPYEGGILTGRSLRLLCQQVKGDFDFILLDVAPGLGDAFKAAAENAARAVLVLTPDPISLRDGRLVADRMAESDIQLHLLLNRVDTELILREDALPDLDEAIDTVGAQLLGVVPESAAIQRAAAAGTALPLKSREHQVFDAVAKRLLGEEVPLIMR